MDSTTLLIILVIIGIALFFWAPHFFTSKCSYNIIPGVVLQAIAMALFIFQVDVDGTKRIVMIVISIIISIITLLINRSSCTTAYAFLALLLQSLMSGAVVIVLAIMLFGTQKRGRKK
ncbi:uncharacterized protein (UPF0333 family) [Lachnospiraceae bacterium PF1-21]|uniref:hypothetical protein n=1 Tax=Ohessyouella blattaphilus TaxID=2949333 RepID=UPI003E3219B8